MFSIITKFNDWEVDAIRDIFRPYIDEHVFVNVLNDMFGIDGLEEFLMPDNDNYKVLGGAKSIPCSELFNKIVIDEYGRLRACCYTEHDLTCIADLHNISLKEALYSEEMCSIRKKNIENNLSHTICNYCVNKVHEMIYPLTDKLDLKAGMPEKVPHSEEIRRRFNIQNES